MGTWSYKSGFNSSVDYNNISINGSNNTGTIGSVTRYINIEGLEVQSNGVTLATSTATIRIKHTVVLSSPVTASGYKLSFTTSIYRISPARDLKTKFVWPTLTISVGGGSVRTLNLNSIRTTDTVMYNITPTVVLGGSYSYCPYIKITNSNSTTSGGYTKGIKVSGANVTKTLTYALSNGWTGSAPASQTYKWGTNVTSFKSYSGTKTVPISAADNKTYTLNYVSRNNVGAPGAQNVYYTKTAKNTVYSADGWALSSSGSKISSVTMSTDRTIYVHAGSGSTSGGEENWNPGKTVTIADISDPAGYEFLKWGTNSDGTGTQYRAGSSFNLVSNGNTTLYARWKAIMNFETGTDNSAVSLSKESITYEEGSNITLPTVRGTNKTTNLKEITITFDSKGGSKVDPQKLSVTETYKYSPDKWLTSSGENTGCAYGDSTTIRGNTTWKLSWVQSEYTISSTAASKPTNPTRLGYTFKEWRYNDATWSSSTKFSTDATITAVWTPKTYKINFVVNSEGTTGYDPATISYITKTYDTNINLPATVPTAPNNQQKFDCWVCKDANGKEHTYKPGQAIDDACWSTSGGSADSITLTGRWIDSTNNVNFIYYDSEQKKVITSTRTYTFSDINGKTWVATAPAWDDHAFLGWVPSWTINDSEYKSAQSEHGYGIYETRDDFTTDIKNNIISSYTVTLNKDKDSYLPWNQNHGTYYALWIKSGKKIKLQSSALEAPKWVDMETVHVKVYDAAAEKAIWKRVTDTYVKTKDGWRHEI